MLRRVALFAVLCACAEPTGEPPGAAEAPLTGVDGARDQADRACHVVLRDLSRLADGTGGYQTVDGVWVWEGDVELSAAAAAEGATVGAVYQYGSDPTWYEVTATASATAPTAGFARYRLRLDHGLPGPGMSGTALASARVQVMPFARLPGGGRLFDHNRVAGDFDNYLLTADTYFTVPRVDAICPDAGPIAPSRIVFAADHTVTQHGPLVPGGQVRLEYDPARLTTCRNSRAGSPLWDLTAHLRWDTGEGQSSSIRDGAILVSIPTTARGLEVWFENTAVPGCQAWDSNWGANYRFALLTPPGWVGGATVRISRDTGDPCDGGGDAAAGFTFDTWARQRAAITNLCFRVWSPGVTDVDDPELWRKLDATVRWRPRGSAEPLRSVYASFDRRVGNDARYTVGLRGLDPFHPYQCPAVPTAPSPDGQYAQAQLEYVIVVNGVEVRPAPGQYFVGTFLDYANPSCP